MTMKLCRKRTPTCKRCGKSFVTYIQQRQHCNQCRLYKASRRLWWSTQRRRCTYCHQSFAPTESRQMYCTRSCRDRASTQRNPRKSRATLLTTIACAGCATTFERRHKGRYFCSRKCRPSVIAAGGFRGTSGVFRIAGLTPAEYAYQRIMQDRGVMLTPLNQHTRMFPLNGTSYTPDFYDGKSKTYIEVSGTRQGYCANKKKYAMFRAAYPALTLKIVKPDGSEIESP